MTVKIKRCLFCGSSRVETWESWHPNFTVECERCGASGPCAGSEADAIEWWNETTRPRRNPKIAQRIVRLKAAHDKASRQRIAKEKAEAAAIANAERERRKWIAEREAWLRAPIENDQ